MRRTRFIETGLGAGPSPSQQSHPKSQPPPSPSIPPHHLPNNSNNNDNNGNGNGKDTQINHTSPARRVRFSAPQTPASYFADTPATRLGLFIGFLCVVPYAVFKVSSDYLFPDNQIYTIGATVLVTQIGLMAYAVSTLMQNESTVTTGRLDHKDQ